MNEAVSLFAGPGGLCLGAEAMGVKPFGIEWDANACATRRAAGLLTVEGDVRDYGPADFPGCTTLTAGPPCQTFSTTGNGKGRASFNEVRHIAARMVQGKSVDWMLSDLSDERTGLVLEPLRWVLEAHRSGTPYRNILLEQVPTVQPVWDLFATYFQGLGYSVVTGVLRAEQYGVPQTRKRAVLLASLDRDAQMPDPIHAPWTRSGLTDCRTMADVLDRPTPFTVISNYGTGGDASKRGRRSHDEPAFTVTGKISRNRLVAPDGTELPRLTHAEAGALQGFPVDHPWAGRDIPQQIGNAVPPPLAEHLIKSLLAL